MVIYLGHGTTKQLVTVGLYIKKPKKLIVEECFSDSAKSQPISKRKISWAEIVKGGKAED